MIHESGSIPLLGQVVEKCKIFITKGGARKQLANEKKELVLGQAISSWAKGRARVFITQITSSSSIEWRGSM